MCLCRGQCPAGGTWRKSFAKFCAPSISNVHPGRSGPQTTPPAGLTADSVLMESSFLYPFYLCVQGAWILAAAGWFWQRQDELPLLASGFLGYVFSFRLWALVNGLSAMVDISPFGFEPMTLDQGVIALGVATLSETALLAVYMCIQNRRLGVSSLQAPPAFINWLGPRVFIFAIGAILVALLARRLTDGQVEAGKSMAFEVSAYLYEFPLVLISVAILLALLWRFGGLKKGLQLTGAVVIVCVVAYLTFGPSGRFQFLGWLLAATIIATTGEGMSRRIVKMALGFGAAIVLFGVAGALRNTSEDANLQNDAWDRLVFAEDANMVDGLALLQQVYPSKLPYSYGGEHLEVLERPIPRSLWPGKPVGGYMNKLGITSAATGFTLGISPGLVGSFYAEGGVVAVVILSVAYGYGLGRLVRYSTLIEPIGGVLIRAVCCASMIPLLRGGDLPGIYAWIFMAFWPCFLIMWVWRRELFVPRTPPRRWRRLPQSRPSSTPAPGSLRPT